MNSVTRRTGLTPMIVAAMVVLVVLIGASYFFYAKQGRPATQQAGEPAHALTPEQTESMAARLAERLAANPDDAEGWGILGRTYGTLGRFEEAAAAYGKLAALKPNDAQALADWADVLAMAQHGFGGEPEKLIGRALAIDPDNAKALAIAGNIAFERKNYAEASQKWQRMLERVSPDSPMARALADRIAEARTLGNAPALKSRLPQSLPAEQIVIGGRIELDPAVQAGVSADDTVFVFVRSAEGSRMPVAALRKQVRDLPLDFSFDDAASLTPERKLSSIPSLVVVARISRTGEVAPHPGDIEVVSPPLAPGDLNVRLRLGRR